MNNIAFCVTGWHFPIDFYTQIKNIPNVDVYVISHQARKSIPPRIAQTLPANQLIIRPNYGYDWGCFQQFLETKLWQAYDYIFFMHDDISILNTDFIAASLQLLDQGYAIVGNGRPFDKRDWPRTHAAYYAHASWQPSSANFEHDVVRGSFFATTKAILTTVGSFEVFWDRFHLSVGFGNYSLVATCGKLGALFGEKTFSYLSETYRTSSYIVEFERGEDTREDNKTALQKDRHYFFNYLFMSWYKQLSTDYVTSIQETKRYFPNKIAQSIRKKVVNLFAGM